MIRQAMDKKDIFYIAGATHMIYMSHPGVRRDGSLWENKNYDEWCAEAVKTSVLEWVKQFI
jgi:hypothetical protein